MDFNPVHFSVIDNDGNVTYYTSAAEASAAQQKIYKANGGTGNSTADSILSLYKALGISMPGTGTASVTNYSNDYQNRLNSLLDNPDKISDTAAYKFRYNQGQQALERSAAAKGMMGSGNVLAELANYGQGQASQAYDTEANRLAGLATSKDTYNLGLQKNQTDATNSQFNNMSNMMKTYNGMYRYNGQVV